MRNALELFAAIALVAAGGLALCAVAGWNPRLPGLALAASAALVAGIAASIPLVLTRGSSQAAVAQAGLVGTVVHLFGCLVGAAVLLMVLRMPAATYWILAFYWATLVALVIGITRAVRHAPVSSPGAPKR